MSRGRAAAALIAVLVAACSSATPPPQPEPESGAPVAVAPPVPGGRAAADRCGAAALQSLVGRPRSEIPVPLLPSQQRVACTTCPPAEDTQPGRLNFLFDADTGLIRQIRCG
jgi:hypothetical protein